MTFKTGSKGSHKPFEQLHSIEQLHSKYTCGSSETSLLSKR